MYLLTFASSYKPIFMVDDKSAACHVNFLSAELIPFCNGERIILGRVKVGVPHMQSFRDSRVINTKINRRST